jgi:hypothetical protein
LGELFDKLTSDPPERCRLSVSELDDVAVG